MIITYDTEFHDDGKTIDLISIGMVREDGQELYCVSEEFDVRRAYSNEWIRDNVLVHLPAMARQSPIWGYPWSIDRNHDDVWSRAETAARVRDFIQATPNPELWAYFSAYDHVALAQLYGKMMALPPGIPMYTNDIMQEIHRRGISKADLPQHTGRRHHALDDARHDMAMLRAMEAMK